MNWMGYPSLESESMRDSRRARDRRALPCPNHGARGTDAPYHARITAREGPTRPTMPESRRARDRRALPCPNHGARGTDALPCPNHGARGTDAPYQCPIRRARDRRALPAQNQSTPRRSMVPIHAAFAARGLSMNRRLIKSERSKSEISNAEPQP